MVYRETIADLCKANEAAASVIFLVASGVFVAQKRFRLLFSPVGRKKKTILMESKKSGKGGRPKQAIKREAGTGVRFTKAEYFIVKTNATKANYRLTEYIRTMAVEGRVVARFSQEEKDGIRKLVGMANNLNQITRLAQRDRLLSVVLELEKIRQDIDQILERFRK